MNVKLRKLILRMSKTVIYAIICCYSLTMAFGTDASAQRKMLSEITINLNIKSSQLTDLIKQVEQVSDFTFMYSKRDLSGKKIDIPNGKWNMNDLLRKVSEQTHLSIKRVNETIALTAIRGDNEPEFSEKIFFDANTTITGTITDDQDSPLPGATIIVKGSTIGTVSDVNGKYTLTDVPETAEMLVISFMGMKTVEVPITGSTVNIKLEADITALEELIVVGYGTMKKSDLTGAVQRVTLDDMPPQANFNLMQAIQGRNAGVNIQTTGGAGSEPNLSIRGRTSLSGSDSPLIVLNGIIYNGSINDINVNDVETIDILKDASAAAVYGARSANGVMIITTKKGTSEKPKFSFNAYYGVQSMTNNPMRVMNGDEYAIRLTDYFYQQSLYQWYATNPTSDAGKPVRPDVTDRTVVASTLRTQEERDNYVAGNEIDWVEEVLQTAPIQQYNLSYSGQSERTNYFISGSYVDQKGILKNDEYNRITFYGNVETKVTNWLKLGVVSSYAYSDYSGQAAELNDARVASPLANNYIGQATYDTYLTGEAYMPYPLANLYSSDYDVRNNLNLLGTAEVTIPGLNGFSWKLDFSNNLWTRERNNFWPSTHPDGATLIGVAEKNPQTERNLLFNNIFSYVNSFGDHGVNATLLYSWENRTGSSTLARAQGFDNSILGFNSLQLGSIATNSSTAWEENNLAYMARVGYTFKDRYLLTGTVRRDGYSGFGADNKFATFPSISAGWVLSEEGFFNSPGIYTKLRVSYGQNGNQGIGRYSSFSRMQIQTYAFGSSTAVGVYPNTLGNSSLRWEKTASLNLGVDYGFLEDRISGSLEFYKAQTTDVLVQRALPRATGYANVWTNIGGVENTGFEFSINTINVQNAKLRWTSRFQFSINRGKITKLYGDENDQDIGNGWFIGEPISAIYDYEVDGGIWTEEELYNGQIFDNWFPGQYRYKDLNDDGVIEATNDRAVIGYEEPLYRFSINNEVTYGNFTLSFYINSVQGGKNYYMADNSSVVNPDWNADTYYRINSSAVRQYWTPDNGVNNATGAYNTPVVHGGVYESRSFVRLQTVSLSYSLGQKALQSLNMQTLDVFISSVNPYTWTQWSGWDPEIGNSSTTLANNNPVMRNFTIGLRLSL
ncbi:MAG: TonB-dependent receptor [Cyclobacteriaceae bacterium]|nr:TonB-dependent receptor [Cyclobacteriaceae bacterium SS2]